jgi:OmpA-OmpF porin, OOP family
MSLNLLDLVKDQVTGALAKQASSFLGESESGVAKALGGIMPTLLGGVAEKASKPEGASGLMDLIGGLDLDSLGDIAGLFGGGSEKVNGLMNSGGGILDMVLGNKTSGIVDLIAGMAGLKSGSTSSLLKMAAPFLLGMIGKQIKGKGLGALTDLLGGQKSAISNALPAGVGSLLGLSSLGNLGNTVKANVGSTSSTTTNTTSSTNYNDGGDSGGGMGWLKWALPLALLAGLGYWMMNKNKTAEVATEAVATTEAAVDATAAVADTAMAAATTFVKKLASGFELKGAAASGIESLLLGNIESADAVMAKDDPKAWFNFDRLLFDTGKATLQATSQEQLMNVSEILKAFPKVKLKIGGYTDNVGNPKSNLKLSQDRANTVMAELVKSGIDKSRLAAEGYGDQFPVGDNATEEGKQANRRISVRVTEK